MNQQKFEQLLEQIADNTYTSNELSISTRDYDDSLYEGSFDFNDQATLALVEVLNKNSHITKLYLDNNEIDDLGMQFLATLNHVKVLSVISNCSKIKGLLAILKGKFEILNLM